MVIFFHKKGFGHQCLLSILYEITFYKLHFYDSQYICSTEMFRAIVRNALRTSRSKLESETLNWWIFTRETRPTQTYALKTVQN